MPHPSRPRRASWVFWGLIVLLHLQILMAGACNAHPPARQHRQHAASAPSGRFVLGTDDLGRDVKSRLLHGARVSLAAGLVATAIALTLAMLCGAVAGLWGGAIDAALTTVGEATMAVPWVFLLLACRSALPVDLSPVFAFLLVASLVGVVGWATPARLVRGVVRHVVQQDYVWAAEAMGASRPQTLVRHVTPALAPVLATQAAVLFPQFVLLEVSLSFLGLGMPEPHPSLGTLLGELRSLSVLTTQPWRLAPAVLLAVLLIGYNELARRGLRQASTARGADA